MKVLIFFPFLLTSGYWLSQGGRISLWANRIEIKEDIPIIEGMPELGTEIKVVWLDKFVPGIETPILGFLITVILFLFFLYSKRSLKKSSTSLK